MLPALAAPPLDIQTVTSKKGITAWLVEDHSIPVLSIDFAFAGAGAAQDQADQQAHARLLANTLDEGAGKLDAQDFQQQLEDLAIKLSFTASRDDFYSSLKTLTRHQDKAVDLARLALTKPRFDKDAVQRMIAANQARIRSSLSDPDWLAARVMNATAFAGHPYAMNSGGTVSSLSTLTPSDLKRYHKKR